MNHCSSILHAWFNFLNSTFCSWIHWWWQLFRTFFFDIQLKLTIIQLFMCNVLPFKYSQSHTHSSTHTQTPRVICVKGSDGSFSSVTTLEFEISAFNQFFFIWWHNNNNYNEKRFQLKQTHTHAHNHLYWWYAHWKKEEWEKHRFNYE